MNLMATCLPGIAGAVHADESQFCIGDYDVPVFRCFPEGKHMKSGGHMVAMMPRENVTLYL